MSNGRPQVICIVSGGMDSVTMLHWANQNFNVKLALSFNYGSKHNDSEIPMAKWQCDFLKIPHKVINLDFIKEDLTKTSALINPDIKVPEGHYSDNKMKLTVVPNRNMIMLSIAVGYAEDNKIPTVLLGSHLGDYAQYPDCRPEFTTAVSLAAMLGTYTKVQIVSPFNQLLKKDIVAIGTALRIDYAHTHSCYNGDPIACMGSCSTCVERIEAFMVNGIKDPLYTDEQWKVVTEKCTKILNDYEIGG